MEHIELLPWSEDDLQLLIETVGDPVMMAYLGGPESPEKIAERHRRYLLIAPREEGAMFAIVLPQSRSKAGTIGYWERQWKGAAIYETGWMVLSAYSGHGIATAAASAVIERARAHRQHKTMHAFPSVQNAASNRVCAAAGFTNAGECRFEYPKGRFMRCNDWYVEL